MTRSHLPRRLAASLTIGASLLLAVGASAPATMAQGESSVPFEAILPGSLSGDDTVRVTERRADHVGDDGWLLTRGPERTDVIAFEWDVGPLGKAGAKWVNKNASLGSANGISNTYAEPGPKQNMLKFGARMAGSFRPGEMADFVFHLGLDGDQAVAHVPGGWTNTFTGNEVVFSSGNFALGDGTFQLSAGAAPVAGWQHGDPHPGYDPGLPLWVGLRPKDNSVVFVTPVPDDATNFNFSTEATENGMVYRDKATLPGGQEWHSLFGDSPTQLSDCLALNVASRPTVDGELFPVLQGRVVRSDAGVPDAPPFRFGTLTEGSTEPTLFDGSWQVSADGSTAWAEFDAAPGSITYVPGEDVISGEGGPDGAIDPFWLDGWHSQAPVVISGGQSGHLLGDPQCGLLPAGGDGCSWIGADDWTELDSLGENVERFPGRGFDGTYHCALVSGGAHFPYVFTGRSARGVGQSWFDWQVAASYCHATNVDLGMDGRLLQCPNGIDRLLWWDQTGGTLPMGVGMTLERIPSEGPVPKPDGFVAGDLPARGDIDPADLDAILQRGGEFNQAVLDDLDGVVLDLGSEGEASE